MEPIDGSRCRIALVVDLRFKFVDVVHEVFPFSPWAVPRLQRSQSRRSMGRLFVRCWGSRFAILGSRL
jgi:hypothetical protein